MAIVRLKRGGKRFEIACYKNKVVNWRNGVESDIAEVLQIDNVFANVSRGIAAKAKDLEDCFGTTDRVEVCKHILTKGQLQVSEKERQVAQETLYRDIATIVSEKCINSETKRPFTVNMIERTMKETLHYATNSSKSAKRQALEVIQLLRKHIPIVRAQMKVRISVPSTKESATKNELMGKYNVQTIKTISEADAAMTVLECNIQPGDFRALDSFVRESAGGLGLDVMDMHVSEEGTTDISDLSLAMDGISTKVTSGGGSSSSSSSSGSGGGGGGGGGETKASGGGGDGGDEGSDDEWPPKTKKSKKKKKKRRGRGQENRKQLDGETGAADTPAPEIDTIVDLCGYCYKTYKAYFVVSVYDPEEVNPSTKEPTGGASKWNIFGKGEKPALWNQQQKGWLVPKKFDEKLDMMGAIKI